MTLIKWKSDKIYWVVLFICVPFMFFFFHSLCSHIICFLYYAALFSLVCVCVCDLYWVLFSPVLFYVHAASKKVEKWNSTWLGSRNMTKADEIVAFVFSAIKKKQNSFANKCHHKNLFQKFKSKKNAEIVIHCFWSLLFTQLKSTTRFFSFPQVKNRKHSYLSLLCVVIRIYNWIIA